MSTSALITILLLIFIGTLSANKKTLKTRTDFWEFVIFFPFYFSLFLSLLHCIDGKNFFYTFFHFLILFGIVIGSFLISMGIKNIQFTDLTKSPA